MKLSRNRGFTLIELSVVLILIGIVMAFVVPRFQTSIVTDELKATTRRMIALIKGLKDEAVREHKVCFLHFDLESNQYWIDSTAMTEEERALAPAMASTFPAGVRVLDVWFRDKGKEVAGQTAIRFSRKGYIQPAVIHLGAEDERAFTLVLRPFLGKVKVYEEYIDFEEL